VKILSAILHIFSLLYKDIQSPYCSSCRGFPNVPKNFKNKYNILLAEGRDYRENFIQIASERRKGFERDHAVKLPYCGVLALDIT